MADIAMILERTGRTLTQNVTPLLDGHYAQGHVLICGLINHMAATSFEAHIDHLWTDIRQMRDLLQAGGVEIDTSEPENMRASTLQLIHDRLSEQLIQLQSEIETKESAPAKSLNAKIWTFYLDGATRRLPTLPETDI